MNHLTDDERKLKDEILSHFSDEEKAGLERLKKQIIRNYVNLGKPITKNSVNLEPTREEITQSLQDKNLLVMCGGGKDSEVVLAGARALQLMIKHDYGVTFDLKVAIGRQPGMIDVYDNLENAFNALKLKNDPKVELFFIDGKDVTQYNKNTKIPKHVEELHRTNALINGHIFSGAGRRTFCDDCNKNLSSWIATAIAHTNADLYMTGDSRKELNAQIRTAVPKMAKELGVKLPNGDKKTPTQQAFALLDTVGREHSKLVHGNEEAVEARSIDYKNIPNKTRFLPFFSEVGYESKGRMDLLTKFLGFNFDSLMFSFTESDCGNPALMCHLYGLIAEHAYGSKGSTYKDGVNMYVEHATAIMEKKGIAPSLIEKIKERYKDDDHINEMRGKAEEFARRAYKLEPEHMVAMIYSPFTEHGTNLKRYLNYLAKSEKPDGNLLVASENKIRDMMSSNDSLTSEQTTLAKKLENLTGLNVEQMRHLSGMELAINNFDIKQKANGSTGKLRDAMELDQLYSAKMPLKAGNQLIQIEVHGR